MVFDLESNRLGYARASCNKDPNQVINKEELLSSGQFYALDPTFEPTNNISCMDNHKNAPSYKDSPSGWQYQPPEVEEDLETEEE